MDKQEIIQKTAEFAKKKFSEEGFMHDWLHDFMKNGHVILKTKIAFNILKSNIC